MSELFTAIWISTIVALCVYISVWILVLDLVEVAGE